MFTTFHETNVMYYTLLSPLSDLQAYRVKFLCPQEVLFVTQNENVPQHHSRSTVDRIIEEALSGASSLLRPSQHQYLGRYRKSLQINFRNVSLGVAEIETRTFRSSTVSENRE